MRKTIFLAVIWMLLTEYRAWLITSRLREQQQITQELLDMLDLHSESLELIGDRTGRTQDLAICNSLALREAAADLNGGSNRASGWFQDCVE